MLCTMKSSFVAILSLVDICTAAEWKVFPCAPKNYHIQIRDAVIQAVHMAKNAVDVIENHAGNNEVKSMLLSILGEDRGPKLLRNVGGYTEARETGSLLDPSNQNVAIFCDNSNYDTDGGTLRDRIMGKRRVGTKRQTNAEACYNPTPLEGRRSMAMTHTPDAVVGRKPEFDLWKASGYPGPRPDEAPYTTPYPHLPNSMDVCTWYLEALMTGSESGLGSGKSDDQILEMANKAFVEGKLDDTTGPTATIDLLSQRLAPTMLRELSHTTAGGTTYDHEREQGGYKWFAVKRLQDPNNADSINILALCMYLWSEKGYWVDMYGRMQKIQPLP
ncbi:hypothetical protein QBC37DRAFT_372295 [Rhypophila decipiens]|uniref:Uncharacterized protein n=1 Tax=Rhypophila decipiens TaxID=261697 RepID=A0AAN7B9N0_9PEZI|nr:hypothetical protein QBC37DRAFT_372295 [Rhypophila decipiens]